MKKTFESVDEYIANFAPETQEILQEIRTVIRENAPEAEETISYGMPAYKQKGALVYFAAFKKHIGFYATPTGHQEFAGELARYKQGKGSVQLPLTEKMPLDLIARIVKFRLEENLNKPPKQTKKVLK